MDDDRPSDVGDAAPEPPTARAAPKVDFGFREVDAGEKAGLVRGVFERVARRYDLMNDLMSGGLHRLWRVTLLDLLKPRAGMNVLDVAGGTGDLAFRILSRAPDARVTVCDLTPAMLDVGRDRAYDRGIVGGIDWVCGDAERLPFADRSVDAYTIAFGLRNVVRREAALAEARRVLKPGGRFLCLELSRVSLPLLGRVYDAYSFNVVPRIGEFVLRDPDSYRYLVESIRRFPAQEDLAGMMRAAGLERVAWRNLSGGIVAIHEAWRL
jgi:demethylmenaquinone methyltransferase/2-methoxy-6-polyprenyl-1,4-benzoquinol methylase